MIRREDILPMGFLKKSDYSGSCGGLRYRLKKVTETFTDDSGGEVKKDSLHVVECDYDDSVYNASYVDRLRP